MKRQIIFHKLGRIAQTGLHLPRKVQNFGRLFIRSADGGKGDNPRFDGAAHVIDLVDVDLIGMHAVLDHQRHGPVVNLRHCGAFARCQFNDPHRSKRAKRLTHHGARYVQFFGQQRFRGQLIAGHQIALADMARNSANRIAHQTGAVDLIQADTPPTCQTGFA